MQNIQITMRNKTEAGNKQVGIRMENGSGGWFSDIIIYGGYQGMLLGSQQFTTRKVFIDGSATAVYVVFNWLWLFAQFTIKNCDIGFDLSNGGFNGQTSSVNMIVDSVVQDTSLGIKSLYAPGLSGPQSGGSLLLERVDFAGTPTAIGTDISATGRVILLGDQFIGAFGQGNAWTSAGQPQTGAIFDEVTCTYQNETQNVKVANELTIQRVLAPIARPPSLVDPQGNWFGRSRPQYADKTPADFLSAKGFGLKGDGVTGQYCTMQV
jgi:glucan 1,3-beta-glucosidase